VGSQKTTHIYACQIGTSNSVKQHKLRRTIASLADKQGRGHEFISLYIPSTSSLSNVVASLKDQQTPNFEKNGQINTRLKDATKNAIQHLKLKKEIPEGGLALFSGNLVEDQNNDFPSIQELVPPEPITTFLFEVDDHFHLEPLREMLRHPRVIGLIALDSKEAAFGLLDGELLEVLEGITSGVAGKTGKGGQSQRRYERERNMSLTGFFHRVAEHASKWFLDKKSIIALLVGGPGNTKHNFLKGKYLHYELDNAVLGIVDTQSAGKEGLRELLGKSSETIKNLCTPEEKMVVDHFLTALAKKDGLTTYGIEAVLDTLKSGAVDTVIVTDTTDFTKVLATCKKCGLTKSEITACQNKAQSTQNLISHPCERCGSMSYEVEDKDIVDVLEDAATQTEAKVEVISTPSLEKEKIAALGGVAAILRYKHSNLS
jgi:peptide chain release factor subunit 1